ncbi:rust resistance kinase Lr10-like isoform X2 [Cornus florida]|uniref:rust resistance kinase Lr10-like isoform X2 n=1 Tax=Cornus florida TaxID=4283 RepID=UPI00289AAEB1|nr:rust resistance kinase Lr10-like isoform X2 [Cornus florida]
MAKFALLLLFLILFARQGEGHDECKVSRYMEKGPPIRFPFWLKNGSQTVSLPRRYPEFELTCDKRNQTVLELPNSVHLLVKEINYTSQSIQLYDGEGCLPRQLINLTLSASSFNFTPYDYGFACSFNFTQYDYGNTMVDYALYNCTSEPDRFLEYFIPCLSTVPEYQIYVVPSGQLYSLTSCTKIRNFTLSLPYRIIFFKECNDLVLYWREPNSRICEPQSKNHSAGHDDHMPKTTEATVISLLLILALVLLVLYRVYSSNKMLKEDEVKIEKFLDDYRALQPSRYSYADIKKITNQFKDKLGEGGYGTVFKGKLSNEIFVAVKVLKDSIGNGEEFINEVGTMGRIHHVNVVRLVGFYADGSRRALVYEFCPNDSLEKFIFSEDHKYHFLGWEKLQDIALGIAKGIEYLHQGCDQRILHFDIKPHNILLDHNFNPKVSDFGLAKLCSKEQSVVSMTAARGTMGYIAPEVFSRNFGNVSYKSDVYSFGMLLLEMVGGRKNIDVIVENTSQTYFPEWIYNHLHQGEELGMISIEKEEHTKVAEKLAIVGLRCIQWYPVDRPSMKVVVQMLEKEGNNLTMPPNPFASTTETNTSSIRPARAFNRELAVISE